MQRALWIAAISSATVVGFANATVVLSDSFSRTTGLAATPANGGFSDWGSNDNLAGGSVVAPYLTTNAVNDQQQTVENGAGVLRFSRSLLNYNLASNADILAAGGFIVEATLSPSDIGGGGIAGRDWLAVGLSTTNLISGSSGNPIGGSAAFTGANPNLRLGVGARNNGLAIDKRIVGSTIISRLDGNPFDGGINEFVFDQSTFDNYVATYDTGSNPPFANPATYTLRLEVTTDFDTTSTALARVFLGGQQVDFDLATAGVQDAMFTWNVANSAYLAFGANAGPHLLDDLRVTVIPEPAMVGMLASATIVLLRRRS